MVTCRSGSSSVNIDSRSSPRPRDCDSAYQATFAPLVTGATGRFHEVLSRHRTLVDDLLIPDTDKPRAARSIESRVADRLADELAKERQARERAEKSNALTEAERKDYERLKSRQAAKRTKSRRKRAGGKKKRCVLAS